MLQLHNQDERELVKSLSKSKGLTLVETIITLAILSVAFLFLFQSLNLGTEEVCYRNGIDFLRTEIDEIFLSELNEGELKVPYSEWSFKKEHYTNSSVSCIRLVVKSPRGEEFVFYKK